MDAIPPQKFATRQWRFGRKRRRSGTEGAESEGNNHETIWNIIIITNIIYFAGDSKIVKKESENSMETSTTEQSKTVPITTETAIVANGNRFLW